ncbi:MAG: VWA domain-containing protein [Alphaproteobacteria bacterium]|nr:VWA domain-containing protein [Alphaproteobacteria bacterium]
MAVTPQIVSARMAGFIGHLRLNGFPLGPRETEGALDILAREANMDPDLSRLRLKTALCGRHEDWERFDDLFEAFWFARGKERVRQQKARSGRMEGATRPKIWDRVLPPEDSAAGSPGASAAGDGDTETDATTGRLVASRQAALARTDLRHIVDPEELAEAEALAMKLAAAIRFNLSRRRIAASNGDRLDMRRIVRRSLSKGGEPFDLVRRRRPVRPVRLVLLLDVSGSMKQYSRFFLQFAKGLVGKWLEAEAFVFHTRLLKVSDAMREQDPIRAMTRLSLMAEGFGGGTRIGASLRTFNDRHAAQTLNSRSVVIILSDGYDTDEPELLARELKRLQKRARRIVWLNPLMGWRDYEPAARAMAAAMPMIDCFAPAGTLEELAQIEPQLSRL